MGDAVTTVLNINKKNKKNVIMKWKSKKNALHSGSEAMAALASRGPAHFVCQ